MRRFALIWLVVALGLGATKACSQNTAEPMYQLPGEDYKQEAPSIQKMLYDIAGEIQYVKRISSSTVVSGGGGGTGTDSWPNFTNFPAGCSSPNFVRTIGTTLTCAQPSDVTGNAATVTTNANLAGPVTSIGNTTTIVGPVPNSAVDLSTVQSQFNQVALATGTLSISTVALAAQDQRIGLSTTALSASTVTLVGILNTVGASTTSLSVSTVALAAQDQRVAISTTALSISTVALVNQDAQIALATATLSASTASLNALKLSSPTVAGAVGNAILLSATGTNVWGTVSSSGGSGTISTGSLTAGATPYPTLAETRYDSAYFTATSSAVGSFNFVSLKTGSVSLSSFTIVVPGTITQTSAKVRQATVTFTTDGVSPVEICLSGSISGSASASAATQWNFWIDGVVYKRMAANSGIYCPMVANSETSNCSSCIPIWGGNLPSAGSHDFSLAIFDPQNFAATWPGSYIGGATDLVFGIKQVSPQIAPIAGSIGYVSDNMLPGTFGALNGTNKTFTLSQVPSTSTALMVVLDGLIQSGTSDYTYASVANTITLTTAPAANSSSFFVQYAINTSTLPSVAVLNSTQTFSGFNTHAGTETFSGFVNLLVSSASIVPAGSTAQTTFLVAHGTVTFTPSGKYDLFCWLNADIKNTSLQYCNSSYLLNGAYGVRLSASVGKMGCYDAAGAAHCNVSFHTRIRKENLIAGANTFAVAFAANAATCAWPTTAGTVTGDVPEFGCMEVFGPTP